MKRITSILLTLCLVMTTMTGVLAAPATAETTDYQGIIPVDYTAPLIGKKNEKIIPSTGLPASYDARKTGLLSAVDNQNSTNLCWSYTTMAMVEASALNHSYASAEEADYSEHHYAYFMPGEADDPLGLTKGDKVEYPNITDYRDAGNNLLFTTFKMLNWTGAASETDYPDDCFTDPSIDRSHSWSDDQMHLQNVRIYNMTEREEIKSAIMKYHAIGTSMFYTNFYYEPETYAYYNPEETGVNHAITIVGWDDSFSKDNFTLNVPTKDGAWLVKNSYGTDYGDQGYFWISYEDVALSTDLSYAFAYECEPADNYDFNYHYDGSIGHRQNTVKSGGKIANVYEAVGDKNGEIIEAVGFALGSANVDYSIQIYKNPIDDYPTRGTALLPRPLTGTTTAAGHYTVKLEDPVSIDYGDRFSVVITLTAEESPIYYFIDTSFSNGDWITFTNETEPGQSYSLDVEEKNGWTDLNTSSQVARIKAYTSSIKAPKVTGLSNKKTGLSCSWSSVEHATKYRVYRKTASTDWKLLTTTQNTSYLDTSVSSGTKYSYTVQAIRDEISSTYGTQMLSLTRLAQPTLSSLANSRTGLTVKWKKVTGSDTYYVLRKTTGSWTKIAETKNLSYTDSTAKSGTRYSYTVRAVKGSTKSTYAATGLYLRRLAQPKLSSTAKVKSGIRFTWKKVTGATSYQVLRKVPNGSYVRIATTSSLSYTDKKVKKGKTYIYTVRAVNGAAKSTYNSTGLKRKY